MRSKRVPLLAKIAFVVVTLVGIHPWCRGAKPSGGRGAAPLERRSGFKVDVNCYQEVLDGLTHTQVEGEFNNGTF